MNTQQQRDHAVAAILAAVRARRDALRGSDEAGLASANVAIVTAARALRAVEAPMNSGTQFTAIDTANIIDALLGGIN